MSVGLITNKIPSRRPQTYHWLLQLAVELAERIETDRRDHERLPTLITVSMQTGVGDGEAAAAAAWGGGGAGNHTRSCRLPRVSAEGIADEALGLLRKWAAER